MENASATPTACVVLGAGAGSRFGQPKAGAQLPHGERFVDRIVATLHGCGFAHIVVVLHPDVEEPSGVIAVRNARPDGEQIESVQLGLAHLVNVPVTGAILWPVDHPFVAESTLQALLEAAGDGAVIARPVHEGVHGHPVYFVRDLWRELVTAPRDSEGMRSVVHAHADEVVDVHVIDPGVVRNIDQPGDI